jgi:N-methylhydantoinase A
MTWRVGVDIGGTFTDVAIVGELDGMIGVSKVLTTPREIAKGVMSAIEQGLDRYGVKPGEVSLLSHATTVVTNALLETKGARTGFIATRGFRDVLELRRSARASLYDLFQDGPSVIVPRRWRFEITERINSAGQIVTPLESAEIELIIDEIRKAKLESIAVSFLFSFLNDAHEQEVGRRLRQALPDVEVFLSSEVLPEIREFERASTTAVCAYVAPLLKGYLAKLQEAISSKGLPNLYVMGSSGGIVDIAECSRMPAMIVESGPAAGVIAAGVVGKQIDIRNLITFDMGGTTAKASLIADGEIQTTAEYEVGGASHLSRPLLGTGHPIRVPVIDIAEVSSGGGSIVWIDAGGALKVGPRSAGADPGPACYGLGGSDPTVSDANVVIGYLDQEALLDGALKIDAKAARRAILEKVAQPLRMSVEEAATRIIDVVNGNMAEALRIVSIERGHDPREFSLICFGGAGPLHAAALATELDIPEVIVPPAPGAFSALGLISTDLRRDYSKSLYNELSSIDPETVLTAFEQMRAASESMLDAASIPADRRSQIRSVDVRYRRQAYELTVPLDEGPLNRNSLEKAEQAFHDKHRHVYGYDDPDEAVQLVNIRLRVVGNLPTLALEQRVSGESRPHKRRQIWLGGSFVLCTVHWREQLAPKDAVKGPAIIESLDSTIVIPEGWVAKIDRHGFVRMTRMPNARKH